MLRAILNKSWQQHPTRHQLYGHLPPITKTIQVRRTRHAGHCWRSRDELIRDVLLWIPTHGRAKAGRPARTYIQQLCEDTGCCPEDLPRAMNDREEWRERVRDIRATSVIWWWWWWQNKEPNTFFTRTGFNLYSLEESRCGIYHVKGLGNLGTSICLSQRVTEFGCLYVTSISRVHRAAEKCDLLWVSLAVKMRKSRKNKENLKHRNQVTKILCR